MICPFCGHKYVRESKQRSRKSLNRKSFYCPSCRQPFYIDVPKPSNKVEYVSKEFPSQDWSAYNEAKACEKEMFMEILSELIQFVEVKPQKMGRPCIGLNDMIYCCALKTFTRFSSRRAISDLKFAKQKGHISSVPTFNSILKYLEKSEMASELKKLIYLSALPLKEVETAYAVDSSGFSTSVFSRWYDYRFNKDKTIRLWRKAHIMVGTRTNVISGVEVMKGTSADSPQFIPLLNQLDNPDAREVSADKAYSSKKNLEAAIEKGLIPYIPFKKNAKMNKRGSAIWRQMFTEFQVNRQEFLEHYHRRSNVETAFHMIKMKFGNNVRAKKPVAQDNEILCKILCHNICCLIQEMHELGIQPTFYAKKKIAQKVKV